MENQPVPDLEFSQKYDEAHAKYYFDKHENEFWRKLSNRRDHQIARKALQIAGNPKSVLDAPCGTGRFWDVLAEDPDRVIHVSDYSQNMIDAGLKYRAPEISRRIKSSFQASAFDLPVSDAFVESVFCIRFVHHLAKSEERVTLLKEFHRVASDSVIISLWVDGNYKSWVRNRREKSRDPHQYQNRLVIPARQIEQEFKENGFRVEAALDFIKYYHMWRTYVLKKI
ncbi:class I SAM-dependent methyltransferase [Candidatus Accumulibacter sp. ACC003]|uniref:class I SAM-dependent methyltransferase n=1 Tax=Candidatus Accumulibacter sp. ACC003 TaxID=2823334 RepID=UPI0025BDFB79|nr:class I SAM-dependent methyltransferase [Candidatus Accumulibacter sp. ACC003]